MTSRRPDPRSAQQPQPRPNVQPGSRFASTTDTAGPFDARDLGGYLRVGVVWVNDHTDEESPITDLAARTERVPDPAGGFRDEREFIVHLASDVPPGFVKGHGWSLREFLRHWQPKDVRRDA